jgi:hypothetical protein
MSNVQWKDPARRARRLTPLETKAGRHPHRMEHPGGSLTRRRSEAFDGPAAAHCAGKRIHGTDHHADSRRLP